MNEVADGVAHGFTPFKKITEQPSLIKNGQMKQYQLHGLSFLSWLQKNGVGGILGDEMGLGKTLQTCRPLCFQINNSLSLFAHLREEGVQGPFLVICPLSVLAPWMNEIARWTPSFKAIRLHGTAAERERLKAVCREKEYDVYVTSYEQFVLEKHWFCHRVWRYVVVDEGSDPGQLLLILGHCLKNDQTQLAHAVGTLNAEYRLLLTGTPLQKYIEVSRLSLTLVRSMNCGLCSISYIPMFSMSRPPMHSKQHSILPRVPTIRNSLKPLVRYFQN